ncbi:putative membrane protein [Arthrobacter stackebrandtii]|uniref:Membrane protein n=1 Tax=Arthrobacter stackebrandtii TaxID=272161 RepID=A0ABS4YWA3_9MICC|nr:TMEM175 family protein [Arthrobacter stackebrandtii]MBP2412875.1 putative membrane protein [Arthrobacter stackebrandtii]PYH01313.1 DUF1211 domain-containing protein [Arthrobacter stackebrandtii]
MFPFRNRTADPLLVRARRLQSGTATDRTMFFSDAVFAIAMTLLVLDLKLPAVPPDTTAEELATLLAGQLGPLAAFILSFVLIGRLWMNHHRRFTAVERYDSGLQGLNLVCLFFVVFLPVPTSLLFQANGQSPWPPVLYALTVAGAFQSLGWLWTHANKAGLMADWLDPALYGLVLHGTDPVWVVFLLSIPVAFVSPVWAMYSWVLILPASLLHGRWQLARLARGGRPPAPAAKNAAGEP